MAQVSIYLDEENVEYARKQARKKNQSLSAYIAELLRRDTRDSAWPQEFLDLFQHGHGDLKEPEDPIPEEIESLQ